MPKACLTMQLCVLSRSSALSGDSKQAAQAHAWARHGQHGHCGPSAAAQSCPEHAQPSHSSTAALLWPGSAPSKTCCNEASCRLKLPCAATQALACTQR